MEEQLISFETAKLAKNKGFDIPTIEYYTTGKKHYLTYSEGYNTERLVKSNWNDGNGNYPTRSEDVECSAPSQAMLQRWLWEKYKIWVSVTLETIDDSETAFVWDITQYIEEGVEGTRKKDSWDFYKNYSSFSTTNMEWFNLPEKALEEGLKEALKLI